MVRGPGIDAEAAVKLNRLRRRVERWTDLLVGHLARRSRRERVGVRSRAGQRFCRRPATSRHAVRAAGTPGRWCWPRCGRRFGSGLGAESPNADLNARIAASILACFPDRLFDSTGLMRSLWLMRLTNVAEDTQGMIDELLGLRTTGERPKLADKRLRRFGG